MKKIILSCAAIVLFAVSLAHAQPYLVCDPADNPSEVTGCIVSIDNTPIVTEYPLHYDLSYIASGSHTITASYDYGVWGVSPDSSPLDFTKPVIGAPTGLGLSGD